MSIKTNCITGKKRIFRGAAAIALLIALTVIMAGCVANDSNPSAAQQCVTGVNCVGDGGSEYNAVGEDCPGSDDGSQCISGADCPGPDDDEPQCIPGVNCQGDGVPQCAPNVGCPGDYPCEPGTKCSGLPPPLHQIIPDDILENFVDIGINIYTGSTPPNVEGTFLVAPSTWVRSNFNDDYAPTVWDWCDYQMTFSNQNNNDLTVDLDIVECDNTGVGANSYITGSGNRFSVYIEVIQTRSDGNIAKMVSIYSGEITPEGIRNYQHAFIMTQDAPGTIRRGQGRLFTDGDGLAARTSLRRTAQHLVSSDTSRPTSTQRSEQNRDDSH